MENQTEAAKAKEYLEHGKFTACIEACKNSLSQESSNNPKVLYIMAYSLYRINELDESL